MKFYGVFRTAAGMDAVSLDLPDDGTTVASAVTELASRPGFGELKKLVLDEASDPRPNALILLAGREIGALDGLNTKLKGDDELSLLPIAHGG